MNRLARLVYCRGAAYPVLESCHESPTCLWVGQSAPTRKEQPVVTMFFVFLFLVLFIVLIIPLAMAAQGRMFQPTREVVDPEWELYQQRYD